MNRFLVFIMIAFITLPICAQEGDYRHYLDQAQSFFDNGEYEQAKTSLNIYTKLTDQSIPDLENKINQCMSYWQFAENAEKGARYDNAIYFYKKILEINPKDQIVKEKISSCQSQSKQSQQSHKKATPSIFHSSAKCKYLLEPYSSTFGLKILSSFDAKAPFGMGFYGSKSYFQFGADIMISHMESSDAKYIDIFEAKGENSNNFYLVEEAKELGANEQVLAVNREYAYPKVALSMSPGVSLKYFSVDLGLGVYLCETYKITQQLVDSDGDVLGHPNYDGDHKKKSYFFLRPTVTGYLPMGGGGLQVSVGYNIVSKAKTLNGFIIGLGFFSSW